MLEAVHRLTVVCFCLRVVLFCDLFWLHASHNTPKMDNLSSNPPHTGPMYVQYNTLLRQRGEMAHEFEVSKQAVHWARQTAARQQKLPTLDAQLFSTPLDTAIARRAIVWSFLHCSKGSDALAELNHSTFEELVADINPLTSTSTPQARAVKAKELFPSLVFVDDTTGKPATMVDNSAVLWARRQFVSATAGVAGGTPWQFPSPSISGDGLFNTQNKVDKARAAICASRRLCKAAEMFEVDVWKAANSEEDFALRPRLSSSFTTTIHLIASGMIKLARLQPSVQLFRGFGGGRFRMPQQ